jgi:tRNA pseudouridine38-40 synthase
MPPDAHWPKHRGAPVRRSSGLRVKRLSDAFPPSTDGSGTCPRAFSLTAAVPRRILTGFLSFPSQRGGRLTGLATGRLEGGRPDGKDSVSCTTHFILPPSSFILGDMSRNIRLTLAYDGTRYAGWQVQPDQVSLQSTIEEAIAALTGEKASLLSAGRTDAGVHALGQVANFITESSIPPEKWRPALQSKLPPDIVVRDSDEVPLDFHATYAAKLKQYRYVIHESRIDDPFLRPFVWRMNGPLNLAAMQTAADVLVGTHDYRSFESHWPNTGTSVRTVYEARFTRTAAWRLWGTATVARPEGSDAGEAASGAFIVFEIVGDGFLYNMVRAIVGTLVNVGRGTWTIDDFASGFRALDRAAAGETAPAQGLYLVSVTY